jgi:hypothetical protein
MQLDTLTQDDSAVNYLTNLSIYAAYTGYDDQALINKVEAGLKEELFLDIKIRMDTPTNFDRWKQWVIRIDNLRLGARRQLAYNRTAALARKSTVPYGAYKPTNYKPNVKIETKPVLPLYKAPIPEIRGERLSTLDFQSHRNEGKCFECHAKGHLGRDCLVRAERVRKLALGKVFSGKAAMTEEIEEPEEPVKDSASE